MIFIPRGFITLPDAVSAVSGMYNDIDADVSFEDIVFSFGTTLSAGEFTSEGLELSTGISRQIPVEFWRLPSAHTALSEYRLHSISFETGSQPIHVIPLIRYEDVKKRFDHKNDNFSLLDDNLSAFDENKWNLITTDQETGSLENNPTPRSKNMGGRPPKYRWDEFWMEATLFVAQNSLPSHGDLAPLHSHMITWVTENWLEQPDERTFEREFQKFGKRWDERRKGK